MKKGVTASYILKMVMAILFFIAIWRDDWTWVFGSLLAICISLIPSLIKRNFNVTLPWILDFMITAALFVHIAGGILSLYHLIPLYDKFAHFVSSILVSFLAFVIIYILDQYWEGLHMDKYAMAFFVVMTTMAMGVIWEFNEWITDLVFGTNEQWGLHDTMTDLLVDTIAGIIMAAVGVNLIKKGKLQTMTKELGQWVDSRINEDKP
jgi:uncharacterized membrane protein YjdF